MPDKEIIEKIHRSACFQRLFDKDGKEFLEAIDAWAGYKNDTFSPDPYQAAYNAGRRSVAIFIHNVVDNDVEKAMKELERKKNE